MTVRASSWREECGEVADQAFLLRGVIFPDQDFARSAVRLLRFGSVVGLVGWGVEMTAITQLMRIGDPVVLFFTSVTLYLCEAVLFWMFFTGLWELVKIPARRIQVMLVRRSLFGSRFAGRALSVVPSEEFLRRFCFFQIMFVAIWSILFKGVLYTTLRASTAHYLLAKGQSLGIAIPAECIILVLILWGVVFWGLRVSRRVVEGRPLVDVTP